MFVEMFINRFRIYLNMKYKKGKTKECPYCNMAHLYIENKDGTRIWHSNEDKKLPNRFFI